MAELARPLLMYGLLPLWMLAGLADWFCHRRTQIETTSGSRESAFHLLLFAQMGVAGIGVLLLEINAAVLLICALLFVVHEVTVWLELRFVAPRRKIEPIEQMIHSFLELLPLCGLLLLVVAYWPALATPDWQIRWKESPLPMAYLVGAFGAITVLNLIPLLEEAMRCRAASLHAPLAGAGSGPSSAG